MKALGYTLIVGQVLISAALIAGANHAGTPHLYALPFMMGSFQGFIGAGLVTMIVGILPGAVGIALARK